LYKIIALDDDRDIQALLAEILQAEGFSIRCAASIAEFEALDASDPADLYLIDLGLPDGSGLAVLRMLKQRSDAGVILLTGRSEETDHVVGLELGADDYVTKPFRRRELVARINAVLRRVHGQLDEPVAPALPAEADHVFDGYRVWLGSRRVVAPGGHEIALTTAEFELLSAFLGQRGRALSRDQLIELIKGRTWEISDRAVDGLVSRLRRKLPPRGDRASPYIRTIHGMGYAFSD